MLSISVRQFRLACVLALVALILYVLPALGALSSSKGVMTLRMYKFYEALAPAAVLWTYTVIAFALVVVGLAGMLNFWRLSRWCLVGALALAFAARPFLGLVVYSTFEGFFASLFSCVVMWLLTVSFWTPIAKRFGGSKGPMSPDNRLERP